MSLQSVLASIIWPTVSGSSGYSTITPTDGDNLYNVIRGHITTLYASPTARQVLEAAAGAGTLSFVRTTLGNAAVILPGGISTLAINMAEINTLYYFNAQGRLVKERPELTIIHEIIHRAPPPLSDPLPPGSAPSNAMMSAGFDFEGDTVRKQNTIATELGHLSNLQKNYYATATFGSPFFAQFGTISYSQGRAIDTPLYGEMLGTGADTLTPITHGAGGAVITDAVHLVFGLQGNDILNGGGGSDYLYGGGDDDTFQGSKGDDLFHGGGTRNTAGNAVPLDDDGIDTADYSAAGVTEFIKITTDISQNSFHSGAINASNRLLIQQNGAGNGTATIISVEKVTGTGGVDIFEVTQLVAAQLAGSDGKGGLWEVNLAANDKPAIEGDLIDATKMKQKLVIDLDPANGFIQVEGDAEKKVRVLNAERAWGGEKDDNIKGNALDNELKGGKGDDTLLGEGGDDKLYGDDHRDTLRGGEDEDELRGGDGNDVIDGVTGESGAKVDQLYGGADNDRFMANAGDVIHDVDRGDTIQFDGVTLIDGSRQVSPEEADDPSGAYTATNGLAYVYDHAAKTLTVSGPGGTIVLNDFNMGEAGIDLRTQTNQDDGTGVGGPFDPVDDDGGGGIRPPRLGDPLILDLDGDGVEMTNLETTTVFFDTNNDGVVEQVGWVGPDDGLLARDINGDGLVNNLSELFGTLTIDGFTILAEFDDNADGVINASDAIWSELKIWRDANTDGDTDLGELRTLADVGVVGISLIAEPVDQGDDGNIIAFRGSFEWDDGSIGEAAAAFLRIREADPFVTDVPFTAAEVYWLPELASLGEADSLRAAMDADPSLLADVRALVEGARTLSADAFRGAFEDVLLKWADADEAAQSGPYGDSRHFAFIEAVTGELQRVRQPDGSFVHISFFEGLAAEAEARYEILVNEYLLRFGHQLATSEIALGIDEEAATDGPFAGLYNGTSSYDLTRNTLATSPFEMGFWIGGDAPAGADAIGFLSHVMPFLQALQFEAVWGRAGRSWAEVETGLGNGLRLGGMTDAALIEFAIDRAHGAERAFVEGGAGDDELFADAERGTSFAGGLGDDLLLGGERADTYVYAAGDGDDRIEEYDDSDLDPAVTAVPVDRLLMVGLTSADVTISADGDDIVLTIAGGGEIRLVGQLASGGIDEVIFANGSRFTADDLASLTFDEPITAGDDFISGTRFSDEIDGLAGNDVISGNAGSDRLTGGLGDDLLYGGTGHDTYVYRAGDGNDEIILDGAMNEVETLQFVGIDPDDVTIRRHEDGVRLVFEIGGSQPGQIVVQPQQGDFGFDIVQFDDIGIWTRDDVRARIISAQATNGDDHVLGNHTDRFNGDDIAGGRGDDLLEGQGGRDLYRYRLGDGDDTIVDFENGWGANQLNFEDLNLVDLSFERGGVELADLVIHVERPEGGSITIANAFLGDFFNAVETIFFADGSSLTTMDLAAMLLAELSTEGDDLLIGLNRDDVIYGLGGNDRIDDRGGQNLIDGGAGDDVITDYSFVGGDHLSTVRGGLGDDDIATLGIAEYARGDGDDILRMATSLHLSDIDAADVTFAFGASDDDLVILIGGSQPGSITVYGQWEDPYQSPSPMLQEIVFADGSRLSDQAIADALLASRATTGNDIIHGMGKRGDTLRGGLGDDALYGGVGDDRYVHAAGDGNDLIDDREDGSDRLVLHGIATGDVTVTRSGSDALLSFAGGGSIRITDQFKNLGGGQARAIEWVEFDGGARWSAADLYHAAHDVGADAAVNGTAGNDTLNGTNASETFNGGAGDDVINDAGGSDIFLFAAGDGHDVVNTFGGGTGISYDTLKIDRPPSDVELTRVGMFGLEVRIVSTGDSVNFPSGELFFIEFSDGTRWDAARIAEETVIRGTAGNELLEGRTGYYDETFHAAGGSDDEIWGYGGNDTFIYRPGDGFLTISASYAVEQFGVTDTDTLWLQGFDPENVILSVEPHFTNFGDSPDRAFDNEGDLVVRFRNQAGAIRIFQNFDELGAPEGVYGLERIRFDDGTIWTLQEILEQAGTYGTALPDILFSSEHGSGIIAGGAGADRIFEAGSGHVIHWTTGHGNDRIIDSSQGASLVLDEVAIGDAALTREGETLIVTIGTESIRIENQFAPGGNTSELIGGEWVPVPWHPGLATIVFADATLTREALFQQYPASGTPGDDALLGSDFAETLAGDDGDDLIEAGAGNDSLDGGAGADDLRGGSGEDLLTGGLGADRLDGGAGADEYLWTAGDGDDEIADQASRFDGVDTLRLAGVDPADVIFIRVETADENYPYDALEIRILSTGETIRIANQYFVEYLAADYIEEANQPPPGSELPPLNLPLTFFVQGIERVVFDDDTAIEVVALGSEGYHANPDEIHVSPDGSVTLDAADLLDNDLRPAGLAVPMIVAVGDAENGSVTLNPDGTVTFEPADGFTGLASFSYTVSHDGHLSSAAVRVDVSARPPILGTEFDDTLEGTNGDDTFIAGPGYDYVYGEGGTDTAIFTGWSADYVLFVEGGSIVVGDVPGDEGWDTHYDVEFFYFEGDGTLIAAADLPAYGTEEDDTITGTARIDYLWGEAGNDTLSGLASDDTLSGGDGDDILIGGDGADTLAAGAGADQMIGGEGDDYFEVDDAGDLVVEEAGEGHDRVFAEIDYVLPDEVEDLELDGAAVAGTGNALDNVIYGNWQFGGHLQGLGGDDELWGGAGADLIEGGSGANTMFGGEGDDQFTGAGGANEIDGGDGADRLNLAGTRADYTVSQDGSLFLIQGLGGQGSFTLSSVETVYFAGEDESYDIEDLLTAGGTPGNDVLEGDASDNQLYGLAGDDVLRGFAGNDLLDGGTGADVMEGGLGNDLYFVDDSGDVVTEAAGYGIDEVRTTRASYTLALNVERLTGLLSTGQALTGNALANILTGGAGADVLNGGLGSDTAAYAWSTAGLGIDLQSGATSGDAAGDSFTSIENLTGGSGNDSLSGTSAANILDGGAGDDTLTGRGGNDIYYVDSAGDSVVETAGQGTDEIRTTLAALALGANVENLRYLGAGAFQGDGNALNNLIYGGAGDDVLSGGAGHDSLYGGGGADQLLGGDDHDVLDGQAGADQMEGGAGNDNYVVDDAGDVVIEAGGAGSDLVYTALASYTLGDNVETLIGQSATAQHLVGNGLANVIWGTVAADILAGGAGADELRGGNGDDTIDGGSDADLIVGGAGADVLTGGSGADSFRIGGWESLADGADRITDFVSGEDKIDISTVDAAFWTSGDQAFSFIGTDAFSGIAGELRYQFNGTDTVIKGDTDGDGAADLVIVLSGAVTPLASDFFL